MALATKTNDFLPAVSLQLIKPASQNTNLTNLASTDGMSRDQLMQMIYALMLLVGENMSTIQTVYAQSQIAQDQIAENQASATQTQTDQYIQKLDQLQKKQEEAKKWGIFAQVMKWIGVAVGLVLGCLLCETATGFVILAAVIAFTASPLFDKTVAALGGAIGKAIKNTTWGNILAQVIILVVITVISCGAEGISTGLSKLASTGTDDAIEGGTQAASQISKQVSQEVSEELTEEITEGTTSQASKASEEAPKKVSASDFKPRWTYTSATAFSQTLMSTNFLQEALSDIPGVKKHAWAQVLVSIIAVLTEILAAAASFKGVSAATNIMDQLKSMMTNPRLLQGGVGAFLGATQITSAAAQGGQGYNTYEQSLIQAEIAPLQKNIQFGQGFFEILTQLNSFAQQTYKSLMDGNQILFNTNFSADWEACVAAQQYQA